MNSIKCFMLEETDQCNRFLRRYRSGEDKCPKMGYHNILAPIEGIEWPANTIISYDGDKKEFEGDPRWPTQCECGYVFATDDTSQVFIERVWRRADTRELTTLKAVSDGAMWYAWWYPEGWAGPDGKTLIVKVPNNHDWNVDGACNNCTRPNEKHYCWIRHGVPPNITVDKGQPGESCKAGAGSIMTKDWHGFLRNGFLVTA